jgi:hypothetical protein
VGVVKTRKKKDIMVSILMIATVPEVRWYDECGVM